MHFKPQIYHQIISSMKEMIEIVRHPQYTSMRDDKELIDSLKFSAESSEYVEFVENLSNSSELDDVSVVNNLKSLWQDETIQKVFSLSHKFCIPESTGE